MIGRQRSISRWWISPADKFAIRYDFSDGTGKANRAVAELLARALGVAKSRLELVRGQTARDKVFRLLP